MCCVKSDSQSDLYTWNGFCTFVTSLPFHLQIFVQFLPQLIYRKKNPWIQGAAVFYSVIRITWGTRAFGHIAQPKCRLLRKQTQTQVHNAQFPLCWDWTAITTQDGVSQGQETIVDMTVWSQCQCIQDFGTIYDIIWTHHKSTNVMTALTTQVNKSYTRNFLKEDFQIQFKARWWQQRGSKTPQSTPDHLELPRRCGCGRTTQEWESVQEMWDLFNSIDRGNQTRLKQSRPQITACQSCRNSIHVPWIVQLLI